jgi:predicted ferric reductase
MPKEKSKHDGVKKFRPYGKQTLDAPFFHILLQPLVSLFRPDLSYIYAVRWQLSRPLQIRVLPNGCPILDYPGIRDLPYLTVGQILLSIPLMVIFLSGVYSTFVSPDVEMSGEIASYAIIATFLTANKANSIISFFFGISFERLIPFHNLSSWLTLVLSFSHVYVAFAYGEGGDGGGDGGSGDRMLESGDSQYSRNGVNPNFTKFLFDGENNVSGSLLTLTFLVLVLSSAFPIFRRTFFDLWLWIHVGSAVCCIIFSVMHEVETIFFVAVWWALDIVMRYLVMAGCRYPHKANLELVGEDVVKVSFTKPKGFQYNGGQFVQIAFPALGALAFHPISISSTPSDELVTLHVRRLGKWSERLVELAKAKDEVPILIEGPYGSLSVDVDDDSRFQMALLVSGGIGVTHCQSVARTLLQEKKCGRQLKHLRFVWAIRDLDMLRVMPVISDPEDMMDVEHSEFPTEIMTFESARSVVPSESSVQSDVFLTKATACPPVQLEDGRNLYFGRPDLGAIVADVKEEAQRLGVTHVAVFGCGPQAMIDQLKDECRIQSQTLLELKGVTLEMHEEIFDF